MDIDSLERFATIGSNGVIAILFAAMLLWGLPKVLTTIREMSREQQQACEAQTTKLVDSFKDEMQLERSSSRDLIDAQREDFTSSLDKHREQSARLAESGHAAVHQLSERVNQINMKKDS